MATCFAALHSRTEQSSLHSRRQSRVESTVASSLWPAAGGRPAASHPSSHPASSSAATQRDHSPNHLHLPAWCGLHIAAVSVLMGCSMSLVPLSCAAVVFCLLVGGRTSTLLTCRLQAGVCLCLQVPTPCQCGHAPSAYILENEHCTLGTVL